VITPLPPAPPAQASTRSADAIRERLRAALPIAVVALLGFVAYSNALGGAFVFDDVVHVRDNPLVRDLANFLPGRYTGLPNRWVAYLSFALNYRVGGGATFGYHLVNVVIHVANALLVHALVRQVFRTPRLRGSALAASSRAIALVAAMLFVAHPLHTEAVAYVVQRLTSLATTFYLATVLLYGAWRLREGTDRGWRRIAGGAAVVVTALLAARTKEIAFTLPFAVALYEVSFFDGAARTRLLRLAPVLATLPVIPLTTLASRTSASGFVARLAESTRIESSLPRLSYLITQLVVVTDYLRLLVVPLGQNLDHDVPVRQSLLEPRVAASLALLAALAALAAVLYRRTARPGTPGALDPAARLVGFGIAWFFLALVVESSVIPITDLMYEHRVYLPSAGLLVAAATAFAALARRVGGVAPARATVVTGAAVALAFAVATLARNTVWQDDLSLWSDAALKSPGKPRPFVNLGTALALAGQRELGLRALRQAVRLDPSSTYARAQLAAALLGLGRDGEAELELRAVLRAQPRDPEALFNLAQLLWRSGRRDEARPVFARFVEVAPPSYAAARRVAAARAAPPPP
jgi:tetratricopeptide (TPR) repeat protein